MSSGKILVRMPPALHEQLVAEAERQGVSLNQLVVTLLAGGIGFKLNQ
jgi:predicted HicB family RNase H-like nuclease